MSAFIFTALSDQRQVPHREPASVNSFEPVFVVQSRRLSLLSDHRSARNHRRGFERASRAILGAQ